MPRRSLSFRKVAQLAEANGFELVFAGVPDRVEGQLRHGGVSSADGIVWFEPDLDHGLQRCEDGLLEGADVDSRRAPPVGRGACRAAGEPRWPTSSARRSTREAC